MMPSASSPIRIARPSRSLSRAERFWAGGLGLEVLYRADDSAQGEDDLVMLGWQGAAWHLELVDDPRGETVAVPTEEDLLVIYLGGPVEDALVERLLDHGGMRVIAKNPYWDHWGATIEDPDGYRLVLSHRSWA